MDIYDDESEHRKKRRRREPTLLRVCAILKFDDEIKGDAVVITARLASLLGISSGANESEHIAICPDTPLYTTVENSAWTIAAAKITDMGSLPRQPEENSIVRASPRSSICQSLLKVFVAVDHNRHGGQAPKQMEVRIVNVKPLALETIYVSIEKGLLEKVDEIQDKFGGGFNYGNKNSKASKKSGVNGLLQTPSANKEDRTRLLVREGLSSLAFIHTGDSFHLPLPPHPITHARAAPAVVVDCEPVSQGYVSARTKIVLVQSGSSQQGMVKKLLPPQPIIEESLEDTAEDTSNDQFFSAAEDRSVTTASEMGGDSDDESDSSESGQDGTDDGDDSDSMDDIISLSAPGLPPQQAGTLSAMTAATPRPGGKRATGTHTPGSIYSSFSTATTRAGNSPGKVYRTEPLLRKIPIELLYPKPHLDDDEDSFVFVDTNTLAKIGCFSGDWVKIEQARNVSSRGFHINGFQDLLSEEESDWRAVRVYGLSGLTDQKLRYVVDKKGDRKSSFSHKEAHLPSMPTIYMSPILITNLNNAQHVKVGAFSRNLRSDLKSTPAQQSMAKRTPPTAKEVKLLKVSTPMTTSRDLQSSLFAGLKQHFQSKKRVVKKGDLLAIPVDLDLGKLVTAETTDTSTGSEELLNKLQTPSGENNDQYDVAWFHVQYIEPETDGTSEQNSWGGVAIVDALNTRTSREGDLQLTISDSVEKWTKYWLGISSLQQQNPLKSDVISSISSLPPQEKLALEKRLSDLISVSTSPRALNLGMPPLVILLHSTQRQIGKTHMALSACSAVGVHPFIISGHSLLSENASTTGGGDVKTEATLRARAERALASGAQQTAIVIQQIDVLNADRIIPALQDIISASRVMFATTSKIDDISDGVRSLFTHELEVGAPDEFAREVILRNVCSSEAILLSPNVSLKSIALQTAALVAGDLVDVVRRASLSRITRILALVEDQACSMSDVLISGGPATTQVLPIDFVSAISAARSTFSDAIGAPKIPKVTWNDVGGLSTQKDAIMETISLPLTHPELFANGVRKRSGILFYGPPGTGKTLLAKAIATEFSLNFFSVKGPELLNMYIGESEANVRRVFQRARDARPCVVFFDELDSVAPKRGNQGDSGGVMDRIVSQLLAELDGMSSSGNNDSGSDPTSSTSSGGGVFVIGATNRPDLLDPALLRPGRFDKMLYLGVAASHEEQVTILRALTHKFMLAQDVNLTRVASRLPFTYTGADLYALCSDAMLKAITRKTKAVDDKVKQISKSRGEEISTGYFFDHLAHEEDLQVIVNEDDFALAQQELVGSVSRKELEHFERIRSLFEEQDISAGSGKAKSTDGNGNDTSSSMLGSTLEHKAQAQLNLRASLPIMANEKGRPKEQPAPGRAGVKTPLYEQRRYRQIGNPDSGADNSDQANTDAAGESDFGISSRQLNGNVTNGVSRVTDKGKGKAKAKDAFVHDIEGDEDEGLYD